VAKQFLANFLGAFGHLQRGHRKALISGSGISAARRTLWKKINDSPGGSRSVLSGGCSDGHGTLRVDGRGALFGSRMGTAPQSGGLKAGVVLRAPSG
jgi:hypothetical protein